MRKTLIAILTVLPLLQGHAQVIEELSATPLEIGYDKTLHLLFPTDVKYCNAGNDNILAEKVGAQPNIVRIIAAERNFPGETNLSIVTADTKFYSYNIRYSDNPEKSYIRIGEKYEAPHTLPVGLDKQMYLIFPGKIIYEDHGSQDITVEKAEGVDNILAVKANTTFDKESNISVATDAGKFYTFSLRYAPNPEVSSFVIDKEEQQKVAILDEGELPSDEKKRIYEGIKKRLPLNLGLDEQISGMDFRIKNIFIHNNILLFRISMMNRTEINYTIDFMRWYIQDAKKSKKTAIQQLEQNILFTFDLPEEIPAHTEKTFTVAVNKLTIPDKKRLVIEIQEKNGGRHFFFKLKNKHILKAERVFYKETPAESEADKILRRVYR